MSALSLLTKYVLETNYDALPVDTVMATKKLILDTLGVIVAGSKSKDIGQLVELIKDWGGKKESTILGFGVKAPCCEAALVNGFSAGVLDYDDFHELDYVRASQGIVPAAIAIAERKGEVNGRDFILAVALGFDLACRLSRAAIKTEGVENPLGAHSGAGYLTAPNIFGAAAAGSKILGLNEQKVKNALGIALMQVCKEGWGIAEGLNIKGLDFGFRPKAGVFAAIMAERGFIGPSDPIEGERGFYSMCYKSLYNPALLTADLGSDFRVTTNSQRPYPCGFVLNTTVSAALTLVKEQDIKPEDISKVLLHVGPVLQHICEPLDKKRNPRGSIAAQHSLPWLVAKAILYRKLGLEHFSDEQVRELKTLELSRKVVPMFDPELSNAPLPEPAVVEIKTRDGTLHSGRADSAPGSFSNPMSFDDIVEKFKDCCLYSTKPISEENQTKVVQIVHHLEDITNVGEIAVLLG